MNKSALRKTILLALIAILLVIYILQLTLTGRSNVKLLTISEEPDRIEIAQENAPLILLQKEGDAWGIGEKKYAAEPYSVEALADSLKSITVLSAVTKNAPASENRYGLDSCITVTALHEGRIVRTLRIGKNTATGSQSYIQIDEKPTVYLAQGALRSTFGVTEDSLRSKRVYSLSVSDIASVTVTNTTDAQENNSYGIVRGADVGKDDAAEWTLMPSLSSVVQTLDEQKAASWVSSLASLNASAWAADGTTVEGAGATEAGSATITTADGQRHTITLYALADDEERSLCKSSDTPYLFYLNKYAAEKFQKPLSELLAQDAE